jgi:hypothetical protein
MLEQDNQALGRGRAVNEVRAISTGVGHRADWSRMMVVLVRRLPSWDTGRRQWTSGQKSDAGRLLYGHRVGRRHPG